MKRKNKIADFESSPLVRLHWIDDEEPIAAASGDPLLDFAPTDESADDTVTQTTEGYLGLSCFISGDRGFPSFRGTIDAAIRLANLFRSDAGTISFCQEFQPDRIQIDLRTGNVRWNSDAEKTEPYKLLCYMAPECIREGTLPDMISVRYLLAVLIFQLLTGGQHPLEGVGAIAPVMSRRLEQRIYGTDPVFIFDSEKKENRPDPKIHYKAIRMWETFPDFIKDMFQRSFGEAAMRKPALRPSDADWMASLIRWQNLLIPCSCGALMSDQGTNEVRCKNCGETTTIPFRITFNRFRIPAVLGNRVYRCQVEESKGYDPVSEVARIVVRGTDIHRLRIHNKSGDDWAAVTTKGEIRIVKPLEMIPLKDGITFRCGDSNISIVGTNQR